MARKTPVTPNEQQHHYYGSSVYNWATGPTRAAVLEALARSAGDRIIKAAAKSEDRGLFAETHRVELPESATYTITSFRPGFITRNGEPTKEPVPRGAYQEHRIVNMKGHCIALD
jgi:hypothetical protein